MYFLSVLIEIMLLVDFIILCVRTEDKVNFCLPKRVWEKGKVNAPDFCQEHFHYTNKDIIGRIKATRNMQTHTNSASMLIIKNITNKIFSTGFQFSLRKYLKWQ